MPSIADRLRGIRVLIVAPSLAIMGGQAVQADLLLKRLKDEGVHVGFQPHNPSPIWPLHYLCYIKYLRSLIVSVLYMCGLIARVPCYDVIHIFSASYWSFLLAPAPALLVSKLFGKRSILNYRSGEAEDHLGRSAKSISWLIRLADKIIVPSGYLVEVFDKYGFTAGAIANIADLDAFQYRERGEIVPQVLVARNLGPHYDIETAIRAFCELRKEIPKANLTIVGSGPDEKMLKRLAVELGSDGIEFVGRIERSEIARLFEQSDIFLNSSVVDNMPVAIIEAFHAGLPVVTTNAGGIPYLVNHGENGLLAPMRDYDALARALLEVCRDRDLRLRLTRNAKRRADLYTWENVKDQWVELYCDLASKSETTK